MRSTINAHHYAKGHRMMVFMAMFVVHESFTSGTKSPVPFKRTALLVCTTDESAMDIANSELHRRFSVRGTESPATSTISFSS